LSNQGFFSWASGPVHCARLGDWIPFRTLPERLVY